MWTVCFANNAQWQKEEHLARIDWKLSSCNHRAQHTFDKIFVYYMIRPVIQSICILLQETENPSHEGAFTYDEYSLIHRHYFIIIIWVVSFILYKRAAQFKQLQNMYMPSITRMGEVLHICERFILLERCAPAILFDECVYNRAREHFERNLSFMLKTYDHAMLDWVQTARDDIHYRITSIRQQYMYILMVVDVATDLNRFYGYNYWYQNISGGIAYCEEQIKSTPENNQ